PAERRASFRAEESCLFELEWLVAAAPSPALVAVGDTISGLISGLLSGPAIQCGPTSIVLLVSNSSVADVSEPPSAYAPAADAGTSSSGSPSVIAAAVIVASATLLELSGAATTALSAEALASAASA